MKATYVYLTFFIPDESSSSSSDESEAEHDEPEQNGVAEANANGDVDDDDDDDEVRNYVIYFLCCAVASYFFSHLFL